MKHLLSRKLFLSIVAIVAFHMPAYAQLGDFFVFPQFVDGRFADGQQYRSTLMIQNAFSSSADNCTLTVYGLTTTIGAVTGSSFALPVAADGWNQFKTPGTQSFRSGYATLTCTGLVYASLLYSYSAGGIKVGEATVFGVDPSFTFRLIADQTEGARVGIAIANNTDISRTYQIRLRSTSGSIITTASTVVGARASLSRFLDELIPSSRNQIFEAEIRDTAFSFESAVVGLRFTGPVFTTIPAF